MAKKWTSEELKKAFRHVLQEDNSLKSLVHEVPRQQTEPVAIVGLSVRLPGEVRDEVSFWSFLSEGRDGVSSFPRDRSWTPFSENYDEERDAVGKTSCRSGHELSSIWN